MVISIISLLTAIMLPTLSSVRNKARSIISTNNQRQIVGAVTIYAGDNDQSYPESIATVGFGTTWGWAAPTQLIANKRRSHSVLRSMSDYLGNYIGDAETMSCPNAPRKYTYLQQAWEAGDKWDNPETPPPYDPVGGTYCFYWNYVGHLGGSRGAFKGPRGPASGGNRSKLLITDYFGFDHWRSPDAYGSCEKMNKADVVPEYQLHSSYWKRDGKTGVPNVKLRAGYTDGHVENFDTTGLVPMRVSITADGAVPHADGAGPGIFYLPPQAMHR